MKLRHVGIIVNDISKAVKFYNKLGFKKVSSKKETDAKIKEALCFVINEVKWVKLKSDNDTLLELLKLDIPKTIPGWQHIALTVTNLDELYEKLRLNNDIFFLSKPIKKNNVKLVFCRDGDDNLIELVEEL